jgi:hypothetical protein
VRPSGLLTEAVGRRRGDMTKRAVASGGVLARAWPPDAPEHVSTGSERGGRGSSPGDHRGAGLLKRGALRWQRAQNGGGALGQERGKEEGKPWCEESRGISHPFIWPGGVRGGGGYQ